MEYYSAMERNTFESVLMRWMNLKPIIHRVKEVRETNIAYEHMCMESRKMVLMNLFAEQQWTHRHRERTCEHGGDGEERVGRMERL